MLRLPAILLLLAAAVSAGPRLPADEVAARADRRHRLADRLGADYALLLGQPLTDVLAPRQEGSLLYLTGCEDPHAALLLAGKKAAPIVAARRRTRELLLLCDKGERFARFYGLQHRPGPDAEKALGVDATLAAPLGADALAEVLAGLLPKSARLHLPPYRGPDHGLVRAIRQTVVRVLLDRRPDVTVVFLRELLDNMRARKDDLEIALLTRSIEITHDAFRAALADIRPGSSEQAIDAALLSAVRRAGARPAYPFVVGAGMNATVPHYFRNRDPVRAGDLVVIDAGAAHHRYAADITRTFPVDGRFSPRQRECYEAVLKAQRAAIAMVRPGVTFVQVHAAAKQILARAGLAEYCLHGTSHHVGLDVHDPGPVLLEAGMTLTVEPGIYIPEERIGIRIEDIVLVTPTGSRVLGAPFGKTVEEIEALLARR